jgi:hypothetical protein
VDRSLKASENSSSGTRVLDVNPVSVALETKRKGYIGFLVELPGAYVRGRTEEAALSKVDSEVRSYLRWVGTPPRKSKYRSVVVQRHRGSLMVEDADTDILLEHDKAKLDEAEFAALEKLALRSGETLSTLCDRSELPDWIDPRKARKTFYGKCPASIRETLDHVNGTQYYYLSRMRIPEDRAGAVRFADGRRACLARIAETYRRDGNARLCEVDGEAWTLKKVLRRFIWHDRIHAKAIVRITQEQKRLGLIGPFSDPFFLFDEPSR